MIESDIRRCARLLEALAQDRQKVTADALEQGLGDLHRFLLLVGELGVTPARFFRAAFPDDEAPEAGPGDGDTDHGARILDLLDSLSPPQARPVAIGEEISDEELDRRIAETLERLGLAPSGSPSRPPGR
jgi:hypothetical protein